MNEQKKPTIYSKEEERTNVLTHSLGIVAGFAGIVLTLFRQGEIQTSTLLSCLVFFSSIVLLYSASTAYHMAVNPKRKYLLKQLDHIAIYILIAGTFTPFAWGVLGGEAFGRNMLLGVWGIALAGVLFKIFYTGKYEGLSLFSYLAMGWLGFLMFSRISEVLGAGAVDLMIYGGVSYTVGVIFYLMRKLKYHHAIWHVFVLGGTGFHYWAVLKYLVY